MSAKQQKNNDDETLKKVRRHLENGKPFVLAQDAEGRVGFMNGDGSNNFAVLMFDTIAGMGRETSRSHRQFD
jgi:hypothetical protein